MPFSFCFSCFCLVLSWWASLLLLFYNVFRSNLINFWGFFLRGGGWKLTFTNWPNFPLSKCFCAKTDIELNIFHFTASLRWTNYIIRRQQTVLCDACAVTLLLCKSAEPIHKQEKKNIQCWNTANPYAKISAKLCGHRTKRMMKKQLEVNCSGERTTTNEFKRAKQRKEQRFKSHICITPQAFTYLWVLLVSGKSALKFTLYIWLRQGACLLCA